MRYVSAAPQSVGVGGGAANSFLPPTLSTIVKTGEAVPAGTIATVGANGLGYWAAEPNLPGSTLRPQNQPADIVLGQQSPPTIFAMGVQGRLAGAVLPNKNFVLAWSSAGVVSFSIFDPHGIQLTTRTVGASIGGGSGGGGGHLTCATALQNGNFVLAYVNNAGSPVFAIFDNVGNVVKAVTVIDAATGVAALSVAALIGGNIVFCYNIGTPIDVPTFAIVSSAGASARAPTVLRAPVASNSLAVASGVAALSGGGFVVGYAVNIGGSITSYFKRFDFAGALQGAETVIRAGAALSSGLVVIPITTGGFGIVETDGVRISVFSSTGVLQGVPFAANPGTVQNNIATATHGTIDGGLVAWSVASAVRAMVFFSAGGCNAVTVANTASLTAQVCVMTDSAVNSIVGYSDASGKLAIATLNINMQVTGNAVYPSVAADISASPLLPFGAYVTSPLAPQYPTFMVATPGMSGAAAFVIVNTLVKKATPVGMFTAAAASGANAPVQVSGAATLATSFVQPFAADYRFNTTPGQKYSVVGSQAIFWGIQ